MVNIKTVLCPVDFSTLSDRELEVSVEICETFGARLVLHHNMDLAPAAWSKAWEWEEAHPLAEGAEARAEARVETLLKRIPDTVPAEATISRGLVVPVLLHLVDQLPADLLILGSHGWSTDDHASVSDRIIESCPCPVLTIREGGDEGQPFRLRPVEGNGAPRILVTTDFSESGDAAVAFAFELARTLSVRLHLLHVVPGPAAPLEGAAAKLRESVPEDLAERVECRVEAGPVNHAMVAYARSLEPGLIVMGRHARGLVKRFFTHDHAREMLHRARCPVWFAA